MKIFIIIITILLFSSCSRLPFTKPDKPIIHSGHFLDVKLSKEANEELLTTMENKNYSLVNLTMSDILIAKAKKIDLEKFPRLLFLNSSIIDLQTDALYSGANIVPYFILNGVCFIGISDSKFDPKLFSEHFLIEDPALAMLKIKVITTKENPNAYVVIHKLGKELEQYTKRLPDDFKALLTN